MWLLVASILVAAVADRRDRCGGGGARLAIAAAGRDSAEPAGGGGPVPAVAAGAERRARARSRERARRRHRRVREHGVRRWRASRGSRKWRPPCRTARSRSCEETFEVRLFSFAQTTTPLDSLEAMPAPGPQTRIGDSLVQVLQSAGSVPLAGVVLFSDGAENGGTLSEERLTEIASYGVPFTRSASGRSRSPTIWSWSARGAGERAASVRRSTAQVGIRHNGAAQTRLRVYDRDIWSPRATCSCRATRRATSLTIDLPAGEPGTHELRFTLDPLEGERNVDQQLAHARRRCAGDPAQHPVRRRRAALGIQVPAPRRRARSRAARRERRAHDAEQVLSPGHRHRRASWPTAFPTTRRSCSPTTPSSSAATRPRACDPSSIGC